MEPVVMVLAQDPSIQDAEAGQSEILGYPELHAKFKQACHI